MMTTTGLIMSVIFITVVYALDTIEKISEAKKRSEA